MKALIQNDLVINLSNTEYPPFDGMQWVDCPADCQPGWTYIDGVFAGPVQPTPTPQQELDNFNVLVQAHIDSVAIARGYIDGITCATYFHSSVTLWAQDADAFIPWRDQVWQNTFIAIEPFESGTGPLPDINTFIASLPVIVWPA